MSNELIQAFWSANISSSWCWLDRMCESNSSFLLQ